MLSPNSSMRHVSASIIHSFILPLSVPDSLRYSSGGEKGRDNIIHHDEAVVEEEIVRAPSLAEEFKRLEGEKAKEESHIEVAEQQGLASQTADKTLDAIDESVGGADDPDRLQEAVKNRYKEHEPHADYRRRGDNTTRF
ncbi:unnamed protein product [Linum trigynum]|uniref:Uncharacterized protein n=1 Tax=Linum trigynum TaxID=586398 RepID=A0AAV2CCX1_9ROSI